MQLFAITSFYELLTIAGYPDSPRVNIMSGAFCFTIPVNPIAPEVYEINVTDSTGSRINLSGVYNTSNCLSLTSDLYPDVCGPFQVSVVASNTVGRETAPPHLIGNNTREPTPCDCYTRKGLYASCREFVSI